MKTPVKESRIPELRLPDISREGIARSLSEIHAPDLSKIERPKIDMSDFDLSRTGVGKAVVGAATAAGLMHKPRSRWPYLLGGAIVVGLVGVAYMNAQAIRDGLTRVKTSVSDWATRMTARREPSDPVAFTAAETAPIDHGLAFPGADPLTPDYPEGLGAPTDKGASSNGIASLEEVGSRN